MITLLKFRRANRLLAAVSGVILVLLSLPVLLVLRQPPKSHAVWFDDSYAYRQQISFTHNADITTDRRVTITIDTATLITNSKMQSDCDDTRFTDPNGRLLRYQLTGTCNNASTTYDVVFPAIYNGANAAYVYYGNPASGSASDASVADVTSLSPSGGSPAVATETQAPGPVSYWRLDEGTGTTTSDANTGSANTLAITGATWKTEDLCVSGKCLGFDGNGDYATKTYSSDTELLPGTGSFTIAAWIKHSSTAGADTAVSRVDAVNGVGWKLYMNSSGFICFGIDAVAGSFPNDSACSTTSYADSQWHHVVGVKSTTTSITLYIDALQAGQDPSITSSTLNGTNAPFTVGNDFDNGTNGWDGFVDEVKYYNFEKTATQIIAEYSSRNVSKGTAAQFGAPDTSFLNKGLVGYWKMDETASWSGVLNEVTDSSGNGNHGTANGTAGGKAYQTGAKFGTGGLFDGVDDFVFAPDAASLTPANDLTISVWVYLNQLSSVKGEAQMFVRKEHGSSPFHSYQFYQDVTNDTLCFQWINSSGTTYTKCSTSTLSISTWYHLVGVKDGSAMRVYINGADVTGNITAVPTGTLLDSNGVFTIGAVSATQKRTDGKIDDVRIYNRALSPAEIASLYSWTPGPVGYWKMDENTGQTVSDSSGKGYNGTLGADSNPSSDDPEWTTGKFGSGLKWGSSGTKYVTIADNSDLDITNTESFTVTAYINMLATSASDRHIFTKICCGSTAGYMFTITTPSENNSVEGLLTTSYNTAADTFFGNLNNNFSINTWYHIAMVVDRSTQQACVYANGVQSGCTDISSVGSTSNANPVGIGVMQPGIGNYEVMKDMLVDDVRFYNYARTGKQIIEDMNAGHPTGGSPIASQTIYWKMDEQQGSTLNNSNPQQPTLTGTTSGTVWLLENNCKINGCLNFDTTTDTVNGTDVGFVDGLTQMTVSFWINPQSLAVNRSIVSKNNTSQKNFAIVTDATNSDEIRVHIADTTGEADNTNYFTTGNLDLTTSTWQHIGVVYEASASAANRIRVYKNGQQIAGSVTGTIPSDGLTSGTTSNLKVGDDDSGTYSSILAYIDEVKIYSGALTASEIAVDANAGSAASMGGVLGTHDNEGFGGNPPVGWWKMDENTGVSAYDSSGNSLTGNLTNNPVWTTGKVGPALAFAHNGATNPYVSIGNPSILNNLSAFTAEAWMYSLDGSSDQRIIGKRSGGVGWYLGVNNGNQLEFYADFDGGGPTDLQTFTSAGTITANQWYHVAVSWDGSASASNVNFYINGVKKVQVSPQDGVAPRSDDSANLMYIGSRTAALDGFTGTIDDVRVYNYVRTPVQVAYDYNRGAPVAWWKFDECQGATLYDSSVNANGQAGGSDATITIASGGTQNKTGTCTGNSTDAWFNGATGKYNSSLNFDGTNDRATGSDAKFPSGTNPRTISAWVNPSALPGNNAQKTIFEYGTAGQTDQANGLQLANVSGTQNVRFYGWVTDYDVAYTVPTGSWTHIVGTHDSSTTAIWVNGIQIGSTTAFSSWNTVLSAFAIGRHASGTGTEFSGAIDDIRIYNYVMTAAQIQRLYNEAAAVRFAPLTGSP